MALLTKTTVMIAGEDYSSFRRLNLEQEIDAHHTLEIVYRMDVFDKDDSEIGAKSKNVLGQTITIKVESLYDENNSFEFKGVIAEVKISKGDNTEAGNEVILIAKSPTIRTDDGPHFNSFEEESLTDIVSDALNAYNIDNTISPRFSGTLEYCVQHNESCFQFVSRLAAQYGEWFYYNGERLIFGAPETEETELKYNSDLIEYKINLLPQSQNFSYHSNDYNSTKVLKAKSKPHNSGGAFSGVVTNVSKDLFGIPTEVWNNNNVTDGKEILKAKVKSQNEASAIRQVKLTGSSDNPSVKLGNIVKIDGEGYRIIQVTHKTNRNGQYENHFEAITSASDAYPKTNIEAFPFSDSQIAKVIENEDPEKLGRIRVAFPWQEEMGLKTPWLRIVSPHTGGNEQGFHFIPEVDDEVLVDFEGGNAEVPYVLGGLYNSKNKPLGDWASPDNDIKAIQTRSGHVIEFSDKKGDETITIKDKKGNSIILDSKEGSITINAPDSLTLTSKDINITASNNLSIDVKNKMDIKAMEYKSEAKTNHSVKAGVKLDMKAVQFGVKGDASAKIEAPMVDIDGKAMTNIKGAIVNLN
ncbi:type VI secretion system Vgr family protein [Ulvibacter litoralis]|uniref:Uncharacterized conserved protein, implicated in type VI secretion and phage assembly n=1 Tax=Ulvibacter litoralis TaxID=227084 RepID=A0A1G7HEZ5_9FLAO|nr:phage baseplate assembly protein V [Ulvibacter litoralis]GHC57546.1 hypothetical protein GCM10008083_22640 [Ulvibacter litoralis]SDE98874.1 Uncharacterized conserved protein, implicated in type VI secretion and phage assembly [Ulvibacter litoralis]